MGREALKVKKAKGKGEKAGSLIAIIFKTSKPENSKLQTSNLNYDFY
jgi:hypothetical protein